MDFETITFAVKDKIATLTLNRPDKMNAFTRQMMTEMIAAFDRVDADDEIRAVIVTGAGRAFCAGADLSQGAKTFDYAARADRDVPGAGADGTIDYSDDKMRDGGGRVSLRIFKCLKPVIGAINGAAVGIGATMLLPMDIRIAAETARFGFVFARRGIVMEACSTWFLPRLVGISQALEWGFGGKLFSAQEALAGGLVKQVVPQANLLDAAQALAQELVGDSAPVSVALMRQMMWQMLGAAHPMDAHKIDSRLIFQRGRSADAKEGVTAFLEKRQAVFPETVSHDMPAAFPWAEDPAYR